MSAGIQNSKKSKGKTKQNNPQEIPPSLTSLLPNLHNVKLIQRNAVAEPRILALWVPSRSGLNAKWIQCRQIATRNSCNSCTWNCNSNLCLSHLYLYSRQCRRKTMDVVHFIHVVVWDWWMIIVDMDGSSMVLTIGAGMWKHLVLSSSTSGI